MTPKASKRGKFGSWRPYIFVDIFALWGGWGFKKEAPELAVRAWDGSSRSGFRFRRFLSGKGFSV